MRRRVASITLIGAVAGACLLSVRPRILRWGATDEEFEKVLPGDELIPDANLTATRGITIGAAADQVWPWIAQLGQGRAGFYSYDLLENLVGCHIQSADRVVPEWQHVRVGDAVKLHPDVGLEIAVLDQGRALVLRGGVAMGGTSPPYDFTWAFMVEEQPDGTTRLLVRERYAYTRWWTPFLVEPVERVSFLMTQKMLRGIRSRAEGSAALAHEESFI